MKLLSWNVNGIRAVLKKGFHELIKKEDPDILCIQETKARPDQVDHGLEMYEQYWNSAQKRGYAGTAIFTKQTPKKITNGIGKKEHENEGRIITVEFETFFLVNVYTPNAKRGLTRLDYRMQWDAAFRSYVKTLDKKKPVVMCGDFNVAHQEIDLKNPKQNQKNAGFTIEERMGFTKLLDDGFLDTFREFNKEPGHYTWWSYMFNARKKNIGWRIDYFCISKRLRKKLQTAFILAQVMGSDHCPVGIELKV